VAITREKVERLSDMLAVMEEKVKRDQLLDQEQ
jgi:hypothetical protein